VLINFAAETHVDNSINDTTPFLKSNVVGVHNLLEILRGKPSHERPLFVQISTDEVYGDRPEGAFQESDKLTPSNPYSASKAAAEMFVLGYHRTYGMNYLITRSSNNYGERQYSEKLIPKSLECIHTNKKIPLHGDGSYVRDWIYVKDNVSAIYTLIQGGAKNDVFNIGANNHMTNLEVALDLLESFGKGKEGIQFVDNRWGQDLRYSLSTDKINKFGWTAKQTKGLFKWWN
jgi:dTDP-glucose 4,6-dehydratase